MTALLDPPPSDQCALLRVVADGYASAGAWPVWQYVLLTLNRSGLDADALVQRLQLWPLNYRAAWWPSGGSTVGDHSDLVSLTVYGMVHSEHPAMLQLANVFVAALQIAATRYLESEPSPTAVAPLVLGQAGAGDGVVAGQRPVKRRKPPG